MSDAAITIRKPLMCTRGTVDMLIEEPLVVLKHSNAASLAFAYSERGGRWEIFPKLRRFCFLHLQRDVLSSSGSLDSMLNPTGTIGTGSRESVAMRAFNCPYTPGAYKRTTLEKTSLQASKEICNEFGS